MTPQEVIKQLKKCKSFHNGSYGEALDMAIQALEQGDILDKIRAEFISLYPKNYAGAPELSGCNCVFSLNKILQIIDKYKAESGDKE